VRRQVPLLLLQAYAPQSCVPLSTQAPEPLHMSAGVAVDGPPQAAAAHTVDAGYSAQLRLPEQIPVVPQVLAACAAHSLSGSVPATTAAHVPRLPAWLHFSQVPLHTPAQHTPSVQNPDEHSLLPPQASPLSLRHCPPLQA